MITDKLCTTNIFCCRQIYFHFRCSLADHRNNRHPRPHRFMFIKQMLLYESVKRSIEISIFQLILVVLILGSYLLQPIHSLVIGIGSRSIILIKSHHTFCLSLNLLIFGLGSFQLNPIIGRIKLCQQLTFPYPGSVFHTNFAYRSAYSERQINVLSSFYLPRKLQRSLPFDRKNCVYFYCLHSSSLFAIMTARSRHYHKRT